MPEPLRTYITDYHNRCYEYSVILQNLYNDTLSLSDSLIAEGCPSSGGCVANMAVHIWEMRNKFAYGSTSVRYPNVTALLWINDNWPSGAEVTMDAILTAMLKADFSELEKFVGIEDAYRVAVWNAPFNAEFYAALARGFQKWPQF